VKRNPLLTDAAVAIVLAVLAIVIAPGLAVVGIIAILVLLVCGVSLGYDRRRRRARSPGQIDRGTRRPRRRGYS
jgi:Flp pilus assembly protein TadB